MGLGVGWLEAGVILVIAVLVLGPERLPRMIAQAAQWLRVIKAQASAARDDLMAAADLDPSMTDELKRSVSELAELHPKRIAGSLINGVTGPVNEAVQSAKDATRPGGTAPRQEASRPDAPPTAPPASYDDAT